MSNTRARSRADSWSVVTGLTACLATLAALVAVTLHALPTVAASTGDAALPVLGLVEAGSGNPLAASVPEDCSVQPDQARRPAAGIVPIATACPLASSGAIAPQALGTAQLGAGVAQLALPATAPSVTLIRYTVRTGDTLFGLARRFGTTVEAIIAANNLPSCTIYICQELLIPVQTCSVGCASVPVQVAPAPVLSAPACTTSSSPVVAQTCPTACPTIVAPACASVAAAVVIPPVCPSALPTPLPIPIRPGATQPILVAHVVQPGEDIFQIAIRYRVNVAVLMQVNYLTVAAVKTGQTILIP
jgi:LysM repeat protein